MAAVWLLCDPFMAADGCCMDATRLMYGSCMAAGKVMAVVPAKQMTAVLI